MLPRKVYFNNGDHCWKLLTGKRKHFCLPTWKVNYWPENERSTIDLRSYHWNGNVSNNMLASLRSSITIGGKGRATLCVFPSVFCVLSVFAAYQFPKWSSADSSSWGELHWRPETEITHEPDSQDVPVPIKSSKFWTFLRDLRVTGTRDTDDALWQTAKMSLFR